MHTFIDCAYTPINNLKGGEKIGEEFNLQAIADDTSFDETMRTVDLVGNQFTITSVKLVSGLYGDSYVGVITLDGNEREAWLSGNIIKRQIDAALEHNQLPLNVTLVRDKLKYGEPFVLQ